MLKKYTVFMFLCFFTTYVFAGENKFLIDFINDTIDGSINNTSEPRYDFDFYSDDSFLFKERSGKGTFNKEEFDDQWEETLGRLSKEDRLKYSNGIDALMQEVRYLTPRMDLYDLLADNPLQYDVCWKVDFISKKDFLPMCERSLKKEEIDSAVKVRLEQLIIRLLKNKFEDGSALEFYSDVEKFDSLKKLVTQDFFKVEQKEGSFFSELRDRLGRDLKQAIVIGVIIGVISIAMHYYQQEELPDDVQSDDLEGVANVQS